MVKIPFLSKAFCVGKKLNNACLSSIECEILLYCDSISKKCIKQKAPGELCAIREECKNNSDCYKGFCTEYWSLPNGTVINVSEAIFCQSEFVYNGICQDFKLNTLKTSDTVYNQNVDCTETGLCEYFLPLKNDIISLSDGYCNCGFNPKGTAYCKHGSDSISHKDSINERKKILGQHFTGLEISGNTCSINKAGFCQTTIQSATNPTCHVTKPLTCNYIKTRDLLGLNYLDNAKNGKYQMADQCTTLFYSKAILNSMDKFLVLFALLLLGIIN